MMRLTGFLLGSALMLALFLLTLDAGLAPMLVKDVVRNETDIAEASEVSEVSEASAAPVSDAADLPAVTPLATPIVPVEPAIDSAARPVDETVDPVAADSPETTNSTLEIDPQSWNRSMTAYETTDREDAIMESRYLVWSPFRSAWAAEGFAQRLTEATGVPVEVITAGPGNYQVMFRYRDDGERLAMVERIETVTGLELE